MFEVGDAVKHRCFTHGIGTVRKVTDERVCVEWGMEHGKKVRTWRKGYKKEIGNIVKINDIS